MPFTSPAAALLALTSVAPAWWQMVQLVLTTRSLERGEGGLPRRLDLHPNKISQTYPSARKFRRPCRAEGGARWARGAQTAAGALLAFGSAAFLPLAATAAVGDAWASLACIFFFMSASLMPDIHLRVLRRYTRGKPLLPTRRRMADRAAADMTGACTLGVASTAVAAEDDAEEAEATATGVRDGNMRRTRAASNDSTVTFAVRALLGGLAGRSSSGRSMYSMYAMGAWSGRRYRVRTIRVKPPSRILAP